MAYFPAGNYQPATLGVIDAGNERGTFRCWGKVLTAANHDAQVTLWGNLKTALTALVLGGLTYSQYDDKITYVVTVPTNGAAREVALQIIGQNPATGVIYRFNLPTVNLGLITYIDNIGAKDAVDPTSDELVALTTAFVAFAVDPRAATTLLAVRGYRVVRGLK